MYIGHYKAVNSSREFYSEIRDGLDFPMQTQYEGERYLLQSTYTIPSSAVHDRLIRRAEELGIPKNVSVD